MKASRAGVTLIELMVVVSLLGLAAAISFPSVTSGLDSLRLTSASGSVASFLNGGLNRAERKQQVMEITLSKTDNALFLRSAEPGFVRRLDLPEGVSIVKVHPETPATLNSESVSFLVHPGGAIPRIGVELANRKGVHRIVSVDPITGVPRVAP